MFSSFNHHSKTLLASLNKFNDSISIKTNNVPKISISLLLSLVFYLLVLVVLYTQLQLIFKTQSQTKYVTSTGVSKQSIKYITGQTIQIKYSYFDYDLNSKGLLNQQSNSCSLLNLINKKQTIVFLNSNKQCVIQSGKQIILNELIINHLNKSQQSNIKQLNITFINQNNISKIISLNTQYFNVTQNHYLAIQVNILINLFSVNVFPFAQNQHNPDILLEPIYSIIQSKYPTQMFLVIKSSQLSYINNQLGINISDVLSNISSIICIFYFVFMFFFFQNISSNDYLQLASKFYILKYNSNNQLIYQNINPNCSIKCQNSLQQHLKNESIVKIKQKLDISNIIKQLKNIQILVKSNQTKISTDNLKRTITTINPYQLNSIEKHKILEYMQLEDININTQTKDIFSSPLVASIAYRLTYSQEPHFTQSKIQPNQKYQSKLISNKQNTIFKFVSELFKRILLKLDIFKYKIAFYFDQTLNFSQNSLLGFIKSMKIWIVILLSYSFVIQYINQQSKSHNYTLLDNSCNRSLNLPPFYIFAENSTTHQYLSYDQITNIASISYNVQNQSYALKPIKQSQILLSPQWSERSGGIFRLVSNITTCQSHFQIQLQYKCGSNTNCNQHMYNLFDINFYMVLPQTNIITQFNALKQELVQYKFNYEYRKGSSKQIITLNYEEFIHNYDKSTFFHNQNTQISTYQLNSNSSTSYQNDETSSTIIQFILSDKINQNKSKKLKIDQLIGIIGSIWVIVSLFFLLVQNYIQKIQIKIQLLYKRQSTWIEVLKTIFLNPFYQSAKFRKIHNQGQQVLSLQKLIYRISVAQNLITSFQPSFNRIMLNTYLKHQLQPYYSSFQKNIYSDLPDIQYPYCSFNTHNIQNAVMNHHPPQQYSQIVKRVSNQFNKLNLLETNPSINFLGTNYSSSKITKLLSFLILSISFFFILEKIQNYTNQIIIRQQSYSKNEYSKMSEQLLKDYQFCIKFKQQSNKYNMSKLSDYFTINLYQDNKIYQFIQKQSQQMCISQKFKAQTFQSISSFQLKIFPSLLFYSSPDYQQNLFNLVRSYRYSICMTNYYNARQNIKQNNNNQNIILNTNRLQCLDNIQLMEKVNTKYKINLEWNKHNSQQYYQYDWSKISSQFKPKINYKNKQTISLQPYSTIQFNYTLGKQLFIQNPDYLCLIKQILGIIFLIVIIIPIGRKYNEIKFVLELSRQLFMINGLSLQFTFMDIIKIMFLSSVKLKCLMNRKNRTLLRSYLQTRKLLCYKNVIKSLQKIQQILKQQYSPQFQVLLKTYIKPEIYVEENIDPEAYQQKHQAIRKLKQLHTRFYNKSKALGLNDEQILELLYQMQNQEFIKNKEVRRRVNFFKDQIGIK